MNFKIQRNHFLLLLSNFNPTAYTSLSLSQIFKEIIKWGKKFNRNILCINLLES